MSKPKSFRELQKLWDAKLEKSGLENIEDSKGRLKTWHSHWFKRKFSREGFSAQREYADAVKLEYEARIKYFQLAAQFLKDTRFTHRDRKVWRKHAEGLSVREIATALGMPRATVSDVVIRLRKGMLRVNNM